MASDQQKREQEIERLAREIGSLIREADPEKQEELREAATALMREEAHQTQNQEAEHPERRRAMNPMAAGIGLVVIGAGLAFINAASGIGAYRGRAFCHHLGRCYHTVQKVVTSPRRLCRGIC